MVIHTDGGCSPNPGAGGWGAVLRYGSHVREIYGGEADTTNNRMELMAAICALECLKRPSRVRIHTDSQYVRLGITQRLANWKHNGWRISTTNPVKNIDLWKRLEAATATHEVTWEWVKGHSGVPDNERADELAAQGREDAQAEALVNTFGPHAARYRDDILGVQSESDPPRPAGTADAAGEPARPHTADERCVHDLIVGQCVETQCAPVPKGLVARVYITAGGRSMHRTADCPGLLDGHRHATWRGHDIHDPELTPLRIAQSKGYAPCERCLPNA
ncbi:ribonuclease HI [Actinocorallia sp. API 0066]|uniref:ribonuclease HI n=1 Tax=Actinocorallia sp. API 0066 TaxID=2896846 RepID=UPI0027DEEDB8|nr:ribonuclease HI [Actinocorallia sp. API 0066]